jgi:hypothetical protein
VPATLDDGPACASVLIGKKFYIWSDRIVRMLSPIRLRMRSEFGQVRRGLACPRKKEVRNMASKDMLGSMLNLIVGTIIGIVLSIIYFVLTLFVVKAAADIVFAENIGTDMAVLAAALITVGSMLGGSGMKKTLAG